MLSIKNIRRYSALLLAFSTVFVLCSCFNASVRTDTEARDTGGTAFVTETDVITETEKDDGVFNIYEEYYVDPSDVRITSKGKTKNLILIYLESMETTYASLEDGGKQTDGKNYIPNLTALAKENISFSDKSDGKIGGFKPIEGIKWTIASLMATSSGLPFRFPVDSNDMSKYPYFAPNITTLGDILFEKGYVNEFLCGSDAKFGGRYNYFTQHGDYEIFDLFTARKQGYIPENYKVWWGYEDTILYDIAKDEVTRLASGSRPFNFTMLTVDTHHVGGYVCNECNTSLYGTENEAKTKTVLECSERQLMDFLNWCKEQSWYEDTVIVIMGDHPRMDSNLINGTAYRDRTMFNCIINSDTVPVIGSTEKHRFTAIDMFPTTLAAMGFEIEGDRLGLGVNMFSGKKTLAEERGYFSLNSEFAKKEQYQEYYNQLTGFNY